MEEIKCTEDLSNETKETLEYVTWMLGYLQDKIKLIENATNTNYELCKSLVAKLRRLKTSLDKEDTVNTLVLNKIWSELEDINNCLSIIMVEHTKNASHGMVNE